MSFIPLKASICGILNFVGRGKCNTLAINGDSVCCTKTSMEIGVRTLTSSFMCMAELLYDILEPLLPRSFLFSPLIWGRPFTSIVCVKRSFVLIIPGGYVGIMPSGPTIFSYSVIVSRGAEVLLFLLWCGIAASMGLLSTLWSLHLSVEFLQLPQQALIDETESLHLIASSVESSGNVSQLLTSTSSCWS